MIKWSKTKILCSFLWANLMLFNVNAQTKDALTLPRVFKQTADSTLILTEKSGWSLWNTNALILSKKGDTVTCYEYKLVPPKQSLLKRVPEQLADILSEQYRAVAKDSLRLNVYFEVYPTSLDRAQAFWSRVAKLGPWQLKDDRVDGQGCPIVDSTSRQRNIFDGMTYTLHLITNDESRELQFYEPAFYEKECPGRAGRQSMLQLLEAFKNTFGHKSGN